MNRLLVLIALGAIALVACGKKPEPPPPADPKSTQTGVTIADADTAAAAAPAATPDQPQPDPAAQNADQKPEKITPLTEREVLMLNYAVYKFKEENNRFPKSLQEMVGKTLPRMPVTHPSEKIVYDPNTGLIKVEKVKW